MAPRIVKSNANREPIGPEERLSATMRYLATGDANGIIAASYRIGPTSIHRIIAETTQVIWDVLTEHSFLNVPKNKGEWRAVAEEFETKWNFPHCLGAIDG